MLSFRASLKWFWVLLALALPALSSAKAGKTPNVIVILADDLGYGDLSCYGHPTIRTPHLDQMAAEGMRFTQFYVAANVCTPSRAGLLTGRLPVRSGMAGSDASGNVLYPHSAGGLPQSEITLARALKSKGYQTGIIGKWHLGHLPAFLPPSHGFDFYFGIPYSNDMIPNGNNKVQPLPLYLDRKVLEENPDQSQLTRRYTEQALAFIRKNKDKPFFLYYPNNFPHVPLHVSAAYKGKSQRGLYGDVVEELDGSVGQILKTLRELQLDKNTLVIFTSDNGPWLTKKENGGSAGLLFEGKGAAYEGGMRVPAIAWWPGTISARQVNPALATTLDLYPTILKLAGAALPTDRVLDGTDLYPLLTGQKKEVREYVYYYNRDKLYAIRKGPWKAHFITRPSYKKVEPQVHAVPLLFNLDQDPGEQFDLGKKHPQIVAAIRQEYERHQASIPPVPSNLDAVLEK